MTRPRQPLAAFALLCLIALTGAGCGADAPSATGGAGSTGTAGGAATGAGTKASPRDGALRFAACMRDNGVGGFPDPDASGDLTIDGVVNGSSLDPGSAAWKRALSACRDLQPAGFTGRRRTTGQQAAALRFAACVRAHGVEDFPDPAEGDPLVDTNRIPSSNRPGGMDVLNAAMRACSDPATGVTANR